MGHPQHRNPKNWIDPIFLKKKRLKIDDESADQMHHKGIPSPFPSTICYNRKRTKITVRKKNL